MTVSVYGMPLLEEGVTYSLESTKIGDVDPPAPTYEEDQTLQPDQEVVKSSGSKGSRWETRLIVKKDGEVISSEVDHTVSYKGHAPVIKRNTSGVVLTTEGSESSSESAEETSAADGASAETSQAESSSQSSGPNQAGPGADGPGQTAAEPATTPAPIVPDLPQGPANPGQGDNSAGQQPQEPVAFPQETQPEGPGGIMVEPKPD